MTRGEMNSIRFDHGHVSEHVPMQLGGRTVLIWEAHSHH